MSETVTKDDGKPVFKGDNTDPLGKLIIPIFGVMLVAVILVWMNQKDEEEDTKFFSVSGRVTVKGKPLNELGGDVVYQIHFYPEDTTTPVASGVIREDGVYELMSGQEGTPGAMAGAYRVVVVMEGTLENPFRVLQPHEQIKIDPRDGGTMAPEEPDPPFEYTFMEYKTTPQRAIVGEEETVLDFDLPVFTKRPDKPKGDGKEKSKKPKDKKNSVSENENAKADKKHEKIREKKDKKQDEELDESSKKEPDSKPKKKVDDSGEKSKESEKENSDGF